MDELTIIFSEQVHLSATGFYLIQYEIFLL